MYRGVLYKVRLTIYFCISYLNQTIMRIYFSIPISGRDYNEQKAKAENVRKAFNRHNVEVVTPFDIVKDADTPYSTCMELCIYELLQSNVLIFAEDWFQSPGCRMERVIANAAMIPSAVIDEFAPICLTTNGFPEPDKLINTLKEYQLKYQGYANR